MFRPGEVTYGSGSPGQPLVYFSGHPFPPRLLAGAQAGVPVPWGVPGDSCGARGPAGSHFYQVSSGASTGVHGYLGALGRLNAVGPSVA